jgi:hypothetical protein
MSLRLVTNYEMYGVSLRFAEAGRAELLTAHSLTAAFPKLFAEVVAAFDATTTKPAPTGPEAELVARAASLNLRYDSGVVLSADLFDAFERWYRFLGDAERATAVAQASQTVLPRGKTHTMASYLDEAGHAQAIGAALDTHPTLSSQLDALALPGGSVLRVVQDWVAAGKELGAVEAKRQDLVKESAPTAAQLRVLARGRWQKLVSALRDTVALRDDLDDARRAWLLSPLTDALQNAAQRRTPPDPEEAPVLESTPANAP